MVQGKAAWGGGESENVIWTKFIMMDIRKFEYSHCKQEMKLEDMSQLKNKVFLHCLFICFSLHWQEENLRKTVGCIYRNACKNI
jgi:hypothetical protein